MDPVAQAGGGRAVRLLPRILRAVRRTPLGPRLFAVGDGQQRLSLTGIGNLTDACLLALAGRASGTFNIADRGTVTLDEALPQVLAARGVPAVPVYLPLGFALPQAAAAQAAARLRPAGPPPRLTTYPVRRLAFERTLDASAACERLGYRPGPVDLSPTNLCSTDFGPAPHTRTDRPPGRGSEPPGVPRPVEPD